MIRVDDSIFVKPEGVYCPHLSFDGITASCAVHDEPWFKHTPCFAYGNPDIDWDYEAKRDRPCEVGCLMRKQGGVQAKRPDVKWAGELVRVGSWQAFMEPEEAIEEIIAQWSVYRIVQHGTGKYDWTLEFKHSDSLGNESWSPAGVLGYEGAFRNLIALVAAGEVQLIAK